jgi:hypothetical protein
VLIKEHVKKKTLGILVNYLTIKKSKKDQREELSLKQSYSNFLSSKCAWMSIQDSVFHGKYLGQELSR